MFMPHVKHTQAPAATPPAPTAAPTAAVEQQDGEEEEEGEGGTNTSALDSVDRPLRTSISDSHTHH